MSRFSGRLRHGLEENALWRELSRRRAAGEDVVDLTASNPTRVGLPLPPPEILNGLCSVEGLTYRPEPAGLRSAREAVAGYYRDRGTTVSPNDILLTASTSEAYGLLFKLLCDPGDTILVPRPSYPLFDILAALEGLTVSGYPLDSGPVDPLPERCRAIVAVHPNNPTGDFVSPERRARLTELSERGGPALIVDEVFLDYELDGVVRKSFADAQEGLVFVASGLSKLAALPQLKLGWIVIAGDDAARRDARARLEHIADAYLSVGTPVQLAAPELLRRAGALREVVRERIARNRTSLAELVARRPELTCHPPAGGWYGVVRLPEIESSDEWAHRFLQGNVYVHPGSYFGFTRGAYAVVSLLTPTERLRNGLETLLSVVANRVDSAG